MLQLLPSDALIAVLSLMRTCCYSFWVVFLLKFGTGNTVCPYTWSWLWTTGASNSVPLLSL